MGLLLSCAINAKATLVPIIQDEAYAIHGHDLKELQQQMDYLGPASNHMQYNASTRWYVSWNYDYSHHPNHDCYLAHVTVTVNIIYRLPTWMDERTANSALQKQWDTILQKLTTHEYGHGKNGIAAGNAIAKTLAHLAPTKTCSLLQTEIHDKTALIIQYYANKDLHYDMTTHHGLI